MVEAAGTSAAGQLSSCCNMSQLCQCHGWTPFAKPWSRESPSLQQQCLFSLVDGLGTLCWYMGGMSWTHAVPPASNPHVDGHRETLVFFSLY